MSLNVFRDEAGEFLRQVDPEINASSPEIVELLDNELEILKKSLENPSEFSHQIYDMLFLLFELAAINGFELDAEWEQGRKKKRKYLNRS